MIDRFISTLVQIPGVVIVSVAIEAQHEGSARRAVGHTYRLYRKRRR
jgi:hypothetical protein